MCSPTKGAYSFSENPLRTQVMLCMSFGIANSVCFFFFWFTKPQVELIFLHKKLKMPKKIKKLKILKPSTASNLGNSLQG